MIDTPLEMLNLDRETSPLLRAGFAKPKHNCDMRESKNTLPFNRFFVKLTNSEKREFWKRVKKLKGGCWLWIGTIAKSGYGQIKLRKHSVRAHRISFILSNGRIPKSKPCVLHNCPGGDNPLCVNPDHLWAGTPAENTADMVRKGRQSKGRKHGDLVRLTTPRGANHYSAWKPESVLKGESHPMAKINESDVFKIRLEYRSGATLADLAVTYKLDMSHIHRIAIGKSWSHVK